MHRTCTLLIAAVLAAALVGCGSGSSNDAQDDGGGAGKGPGAGKPKVTLGTKNFTEQFILGELYAQALRAKGWKVDLKSDIGSTEVVDRALSSGGIDLYPEYTGTTLSVVKGDPMPPRNGDEAYRQAKAFYEQRGQTLLEATPFEDRDAIAVTKAFARRHGGLHTTADLKELPGTVRIGGAPEFRTRRAGLLGLQEAYGLENLRYVPLEIGEAYKALDDGRVDVADVFTTDGQLASGKYVVLKDPKGVFGAQNVAPVVSRKVLKEQGQGFAETLDAVSGKLTDEVMQQMNAAVALQKQTPAEVARAFLSEHSLN